MTEDSLVIADQHAAVNMFPALVHTARHTMEAGSARSPSLNPLWEGAAEGKLGN